MSNTYPDLNCNFPDEIDQRLIMVDPSNYTDLTAINSFQSAMEAGEFNTAATILEGNDRLRRMLFNAAKWNRHEDMIIAIQRMWSGGIAAYLAAAAENAGAGISGILFPDGKSLAEKSEEWDSQIDELRVNGVTYTILPDTE